MVSAQTKNAYPGKTLDTPAFHFLIEPMLPVLHGCLGSLYTIRWTLSRPLYMRILPKWFPELPIPVLRWVPYVTLGEVLLSVPFAMLLMWGYSLTFVSPSIDASGDVAGAAIIIAFLTANKSNSIFSLLLGIPFERMIPFHNLSALTAVVLGCFHTYVVFAFGDEAGSGSGDSRDRRLSGDGGSYAMTGTDPDFVKFAFDGGTNMSGTLLLLAMIGLTVLSIFPVIRRHFFDFWLWTHILLAIATIVFSVMHSVALVIFVGIWWGIDVAIRYLVMAVFRYPNSASIRRLQGDVTEISFHKPPGFEYNAGQFIQIAVPKLSLTQFHPISISSAPHEEKVTLHIRSLGGWTAKLLKLAEQEEEIKILLEGPYGSPAVDLDDDSKYKRVLLVTGGIGATHTHSIAKSLLHNYEKGRDLKKIHYVWAVRNLAMVEDMPPPSTAKVVSSNKVYQDSRERGYPGTLGPISTDDCSASYSNGEILNDEVELVQTDIYLTSKQTDSESPTPRHASWNICSGRPDLDAIFKATKQEAQQNKEVCVAVIGCGPNSLMDQLKEACRKHSEGVFGCGGVTFDLHHEIFEF